MMIWVWKSGFNSWNQNFQKCTLFVWSTVAMQCSTPQFQVHLAPVVELQLQVLTSWSVRACSGRASWKPQSEVWSRLPPFFQFTTAGEPWGVLYCVCVTPRKSTLSDITLGEVLASPLDALFCPDEQQVWTHLVKRALQESGDQSTLILRTGGQVCYKDKQHLKYLYLTNSTYFCDNVVILFLNILMNECRINLSPQICVGRCKVCSQPLWTVHKPWLHIHLVHQVVQFYMQRSSSCFSEQKTQYMFDVQSTTNSYNN